MWKCPYSCFHTLQEVLNSLPLNKKNNNKNKIKYIVTILLVLLHKFQDEIEEYGLDWNGPLPESDSD